MLRASELRNGTTFIYQNGPWKVLAYKHTHLARGGADVRLKIKNLISNKIKSQVFSSNERFEEAIISRQSMQFLYQESGDLVFMHPTTFNQVTIETTMIDDLIVKFLKEGEEVPLLFWEDKVIGIDFPPKVTLEVIECDPGVKGDSATNIYKPAKLTNGIVSKVPLFIKVGDKVKIDTRTGEYVERDK